MTRNGSEPIYAQRIRARNRSHANNTLDTDRRRARPPDLATSQDIGGPRDHRQWVGRLIVKRSAARATDDRDKIPYHGFHPLD